MLYSAIWHRMLRQNDWLTQTHKQISLICLIVCHILKRLSSFFGKKSKVRINFSKLNIKLTAIDGSSPMFHRTGAYNKADREDGLDNPAKIQTYWAQAGIHPNAADAE